MPKATQKQSFFARFPVIAFLLLTFAISWSVVLFSALTIVAGKGEQIGMLALIFIGQFGPSLAALYIVRRLYGWKGVGAYFRSAFAVFQPVSLIAIALFLSPAIFAASLLAAIANGAPAPNFSSDIAKEIAAAFAIAVGLGLVFGGLSEELGWRGFLLPRLQRRIGFIGAGILIGVLWSVWHLEPEYVALGITEGWDAFWAKERANLILYLGESIPISLIMVWLFNQSRGSLFLMILFHASSNATITASRLLFEERPAMWYEFTDWAHWIVAILLVLLSFRQPRERLDAAEKQFGF